MRQDDAIFSLGFDKLYNISINGSNGELLDDLSLFAKTGDTR